VSEPVFLTAEWRNLVMLNYVVPTEVLEPLVPKGTELDLFAGEALVSVVAFHFLRTRVKGLAIPGHMNFEEVNLRFYVKREAGGEIRRGVVFIKELVPRIAIVAIARLFYHEPYSVATIRSFVAPEQIDFDFTYRGKVSWMYVNPRRELKAPEPGSVEEFVVEHYWGYTRQPDGGTKEYQVEHPSWLIQRAIFAKARFAGDLQFGEPWGSIFTKPVTSALVAEGSPVVVRRGVRI
jgi:uncharacterized protein YqjF (DUF2071 family)